MDIIKIYDPANSGITDEQIAAMKDLSDEQIKSLAEAYPNQPHGNAYLVYYNTNEQVNQQRYPLGTWGNLYNLRKLGKKELIAFNFFKHFNKPKSSKPATQRTVDLSAEDLKNAEGINHASAMVANASALSPNNSTAKPNNVTTTNQADSEFEHIEKNPELANLESQLAKAKEEKAHHMTIKKLENQIEEFKNKNIAT